MKPGDYWKERMAAVEDMSHEKGINYAHNVEQQFRQAEKALSDKITIWYKRLADNNEISLSAAKTLLRKDELEDFHMSVDEYIKKGKTLKYSDQYAKQLENASAKVHISRLEAIKLQMQQECEVLYGNMTDDLDAHLRDVYTEGYYHTAFELQKGINIGWAFNKLDNRKIEKVINTCWTNDGKNFSSRIWSDRNKLVNELNTILTQNIIRGEDPQKAINQLAHRMNVSKHNAGRLIMTETAATYSMSQRDCYKELDVEQFKFLATLDTHTSEICRKMDGKHFEMSDYQIGVNAPPLHCFCRSCTIPYFNDEFTVGEKRAARGKDGKTCYVSSDMTYEDWKKAFVSSDKSEFKEKNVKSSTKYDSKFKKVKERLSKKAMPNSNSVIDATQYTDKGITYKVDNRNVLLDYSDREKQIAEIYEKTFGGEIMMIPRVLNPKGISTPDYLIDNKKFDLKELHGQSKNLVYNAIAKKKRQADNFILDITNCPLDEGEIYRQIEDIFNKSSHASFVNIIVVIKGDDILEVYQRIKK